MNNLKENKIEDFKKYLVINVYNNIFQIIKLISVDVNYAKIHILYYYDIEKDILKSYNKHIIINPKEYLIKNMDFESDSLSECMKFIYFKKDVNKYNL